MASSPLRMSDLGASVYRHGNKPAMQQSRQSVTKGSELHPPNMAVSSISAQFFNMQKGNEDLLDQSQRLLLNLVTHPSDTAEHLVTQGEDSVTATIQHPVSSNGSLHSETESHVMLQHSLAEQSSQHILLQHRVKRGEEEVQFLRQQMSKNKTSIAKEQIDLRQQLVQSRASLDDLTRTLRHQEQELSAVRARLASADDALLQKTSMVACLQTELTDSEQRRHTDMERCSSELAELKHAQLLERDTVSRKIDEVVRHVREKEEELETVLASISTHEMAMQAKDRLISSLEEKLQICRTELEQQTTEIVSQRQKFSGLQRDAENGERQVFQLTASLQQCQTQLELHIKETKSAESLRTQHHVEISQLKNKLSLLENTLGEKSRECGHLRSVSLELEAEIAKQKHAYSFAEQGRHDAESSVVVAKAELSQRTAELELCQGEVQRERLQKEDLVSVCKRLEHANQEERADTSRRLEVEQHKLAKVTKQMSQLEAAHEKQKEQLVQAKLQYDKQWQTEVQLTEKLTEANAELLKCRKELQGKQEELTHTELHVEEAKSQLHATDVQCSQLRDVVQRQKQSMMQRASQVNELVLNVQSCQSKQQDEVDTLHIDLRQLQTQLQSSHGDCLKHSQDLQVAETARKRAVVELHTEQESHQRQKESSATLQKSLLDCKQRVEQLGDECSQLRALLHKTQAENDEKAAAVECAEAQRCIAERKSVEMEEKLRDIHHRLTTTSTANHALTHELHKVSAMATAGDEVSLSRVCHLEEQLCAIQDAYKKQVTALQSKHAQMLLAVQEKETSHRLEMTSQMELLDSLRKQETEAQLTAAQCSAELVRVKKQLLRFQQDAALKDSTMKEVDIKLSHLERSVAQTSTATAQNKR